jgi:hypothetical protein
VHSFESRIMEESHPAIDLGWERGFSFTVSHVSKVCRDIPKSKGPS